MPKYKTVQTDGYAGIRNTVSPERLAKNDMVSAVNVDIDRTGKASRRSGRVQILTGACHSLWSDGTDAFFVESGTIRRLNPDLTVTAVQAGVTGPRVSYARIAYDVYWSDGVQNGIISPSGVRPWGITVPAVPNVAIASGQMRPGIYLCAITFVRSNGLESGASRLVSLTLPINSGISFTNLPVSNDPLVTEKRIYVTTPDGELPYLATTVPNAATTALVQALPAGMPLATRSSGPPPPGQIVGEWSGYSFVAAGSFLWYSHAYQHELFSLRDGFIAIGGPVHIFAPVSDGIYVATDSQTFFLKGEDPAKFVSNLVASYGGVRGTECAVRNDFITDKGVKGLAVMWASPEGICLGLDGGDFKNLTSARYTLAVSPTSGASLFKIHNGTPQFLTTLDA